VELKDEMKTQCSKGSPRSLASVMYTLSNTCSTALQKNWTEVQIVFIGWDVVCQ